MLSRRWLGGSVLIGIKAAAELNHSFFIEIEGFGRGDEGGLCRTSSFFTLALAALGRRLKGTITSSGSFRCSVSGLESESHSNGAGAGGPKSSNSRTSDRKDPLRLDDLVIMISISAKKESFRCEAFEFLSIILSISETNESLRPSIIISRSPNKESFLDVAIKHGLVQ
ncbi:unnamed protein product [Heterosigma akashiwo]